MADVSFNVFNPYQQQQEELARRQKMADILQQQALQPIERSSYAGIEAPISPFAGLAKVLQMYTSGAEENKIAQEKKLLNEKYQSDLANVLSKASELQAGKPATPEQPPSTPVDDEGNPRTGVPAMPAVPPNPLAAAREYMKHPATQALGMQMLQKNAQMQAFINAGMQQNNPQTNPQTPVSTTPLTPTAPPTANQSSLPTVPQAGQQSITTSTAQPVSSALAKFGGPAGGVSFEVWMQIDPTGAKYTEQLAKDNAEQNKPTDLMRQLKAAGIQEGSPAWNRALTDTATQGGIWTLDPITGKRSLAEGYAAGQGAIQGAQEAEKAKFDIVEVPILQPNGTSIMQKMTRAQAAEMLGRNAPGQNQPLNLRVPTIALGENLARQLANFGKDFRISVDEKEPTPGVQSGGIAASKALPSAQPTGFGVSNPTASDIAAAREKQADKTIIERLDASFSAAQSAEERLKQVQNIRQVLDAPLISGPGATTQMFLSQLANKMYGVSNNETLANTRQLITGLSELSLSARGALKGQGTITESEGALLTKARSAPETLTVPEYKRLFSLFEKQDKRAIQQHEDIRSRAAKSGISNIDFWRVDLPSEAPSKPATLNLSPAAQDAVKKAMGAKP